MGRVGPAIASALRASGYPIVAVAARSAQSHERAQVMLPGVPIHSLQRVSDLSDILFLAVPDEEIEPLTKQLAEGGHLRPGQVVIHLCGAKGPEALGSAMASGALPIALHPVMTFSGSSLDVHNLQETPIAYTCAPLVEPLAVSIIQALGGVAFPVRQEDRPLYHAALAHASNHLLTVIVQATRILSEAGIEDPGRVLEPLVKISAARALEEGIQGLTGPLQRGDMETVRAHRDRIGSVASLASVSATYGELARATLAELNGEHGHITISQPRVPKVLTTKSELRQTLETNPGKLGLVMTMGALHEGHLSLVRMLRGDHDRVLVTIFVNPTQFGEGEDFDKYPRTLQKDLDALGVVGVDWVYAPSVEEVYPNPPRVTIQPSAAAEVLEGALRPGHFAGVLQIIGKVLNLVRPDTAVFGQKDAQQFVNIRQMVQDLDYPIELIEAPIVRDEDGLALSSRNAYLSGEQREQALALSRGLLAGQEVADSGGSAHEIVAVAAEVLSQAPGVHPEYVALADRESFEVLAVWTPDNNRDVTNPARSGSTRAADAYLLVAARVGTTRLIDNAKVQVYTGV